MVPTTSGAPALCHFTDLVMSGCALMKVSIIGPVSFWSPATSRMFSYTGADGLAGMVPAAEPAEPVAAVPEPAGA
jgi:hypothetical protein